MNCFIFQYHFAFYYVTKHFTESNMTKYDSRGLRTSSCFGGHRPDANTPGRHIHEEQMSFFLAGDGTGQFYCYQLGEKYFKTLLNNEERICVYSAGWTPSTLFLSWIAMALHHGGIRWQNAIEAVDELVDSEKEVVFHKKNSFDLDQRAKEQKIAQLRTYFWVLEAYKLFEDSLTKTVEAWEHFERGSLHKVNDGRNDEDYDVSVELIELSIERLRKRIDWVSKKSEQVSRLREGLRFGAQMSDTSVAISKNDNIRLLTYFNILFLPLSLSATLFSMQFLQGTQWQAFAGVTALMTLTTIVTVFLITHKVQDLVTAIGQSIPKYGVAMRHTLIGEVSERVQDAAEVVQGVAPSIGASNLQVEDVASKMDILSSLATVTSLCFITVPVSEVREAINLYGLLEEKPDNIVRDDESSGLEIISMYGHSTGLSQRAMLSRGTASSPGGLRAPNCTTTVNTGTTCGSYDPDPRGNNVEPKPLRNQVQHALGELAELPRPQPTTKWKAGRILQQGLSIAFRAFITLSIWIPLLLLEYIFLLIYYAFYQCIAVLVNPSEGNDRDALGLDLGRQRTDDHSTQVKRFFAYPVAILLSQHDDQHPRRLNSIHSLPSMRELVTSQTDDRPAQQLRDFVHSRRSVFFPDRNPQAHQSSQGMDPGEQEQQQQATWLMTTPTPTYIWSSRTPSLLGPGLNPSPNPELGRSPLLPSQHLVDSPGMTSGENVEGGNQASGWGLPPTAEGDVRVPTRAIIIHRRGFSDLEG